MARKIRKGCSVQKKKEVGLGRSSPEFKAVLAHMQQLKRALAANKDAKRNLFEEFKMAEWIDVQVKSKSPGVLVDIALNQIERSSSNYKEFYTMLNKTTGLKGLGLPRPQEGIHIQCMLITIHGHIQVLFSFHVLQFWSEQLFTYNLCPVEDLGGGGGVPRVPEPPLVELDIGQAGRRLRRCVRVHATWSC